MARNRKRKQEEEGNGGAGYEYEKLREQRIKDNKERLQKLGILELALNLKIQAPKFPNKPSPPSGDKTHNLLPPNVDPPRRSSRLKTLDPVSYVVTRNRKFKSSHNDGTESEIHLDESWKPEIYTDEHEKLLGDCQLSWTLRVDGYGNDGKRILDPVNGKKCHQCGFNTVGHHTHCSKCKLIQGQLCGDCLYMRYGENVIEANQNPNWICPFCRGICNCNLCRRQNRWTPIPTTSYIYKKIRELGFKSIAHYLIHASRGQSTTESLVSEEPSAGTGSPHSLLNDDPTDTDEDPDRIPRTLAEER